MNIRPEQRCEADIKRTTIRQGSTREVWGFGANRPTDLGPDTPEITAIEEVTIDCPLNDCPLKGIKFQAEGGAPFGAINAANEQTADMLAAQCEKWQALKRVTGAEKPGSDFHSQLSGWSR